MQQTMQSNMLRPCRPSATRCFQAFVHLPNLRNRCLQQPKLTQSASVSLHSSMLHIISAKGRRTMCCRGADAATPLTGDDIVRVAAVGDLVYFHFTCKDKDGQVLESSYDAEEPICFEVGAGDMMGNKLFQGFDEAVRGMAAGQKTVLEASGGEWQQELLFTIPLDHPEVQRLQGRYKSHGGLQRGLVVELANGAMALILEVNETSVKIDANNMMAGKNLLFELEVVAIETAPPAESL